MTSRVQEYRALDEEAGGVNARAAAWLAWSVCGLTLALIASSAVLFVLNRFGIRELPYFLVAEATAALVGGLISSRRPRNR